MAYLSIVIVFAIAFTSPAAAQIYEWRDASGSRNFTNDIEDIPGAQRDDAKIIVRAPRNPRPTDSAETDGHETAPVVEARRPDRERRRAAMERWRAEREELRRERERARGAEVIYDNSFRFASFGGPSLRRRRRSTSTLPDRCPFPRSSFPNRNRPSMSSIRRTTSCTSRWFRRRSIADDTGIAPFACVCRTSSSTIATARRCT